MRSISKLQFSAVLLLLAALITGAPLSAQSASSSAYGASAGVAVKPVIGAQITASVGPLPTASGSAPPAYVRNNSAASVSLSTLLTGQLLNTGVLTAHAEGNTATPTAVGRASVDGLNLALPLLLGLSADAVQSEAVIDVVNGVPTAHGSTTLANAHATGVLGLGLNLLANPAPNTVLLDLLGIRLVLNEQIVTNVNGTLSIEVNAIHLTLINVVLTGIGQITGDVVIGSSQASLGGLSSQVSVSQTASPSTVTAGGQTTYTITINNAGPLTANVTSLTEVLPESFSFVSSSAGTPSINGSQLTFSTPFTILPGASRVITIVANVGSTPGTFTSNATVTGSNFPTATTGPSAPVTVTAPISNGTISGTVHDSTTGAVLPNATVTLRDSNGNIVATTTTNGSGTYSLPNVPPGSYSVTFSATGYAPSTQPATVGSGASVQVNGSLAPLPGTIQGTVIDGNTGLPVPGATVTITINGTPTTTTTDSNGHYIFTNVPAETPVTVTIQQPGYEPEPPYTVTLPPGGNDTRTVSLDPSAGTVQGTVIDGNTGLPVQGATVTITVNGTPTTTTTDANGHYVFTNIPPGTPATVTIQAPGYEPEPPYTVTLPPGGSDTRTVSLDPSPGTVQGTVIDGTTGLPIQGATVTITINGTPTTVTTNANGHYIFTNVPAGTPVTVTIQNPGYEPEPPYTVTLPPGGNDTRTVSLDPSPGTVQGTVIDGATGLPVQGATVTITINGTPTTVTTDANGHYIFTNVPAGTPVTVSITHPNYQTQPPYTVTLTPGGNDTRTVSLTPLPGTINGTILDGASQQPLAGATVRLLDANGQQVAIATTDAQGHYSFPNLPPGNYSIVMSAPGYATATVQQTVGANQVVTRTDALTPNPGTISGTITDAVTGLPIAGATVTLTQGSVTLTATTDASGHYSFTNVIPDMQATVSASAPNHQTASTTVTVTPGGSSTTNLQLQPLPGSISGRVSDASTNAPIANAVVELLSNGNVIATTTTNASGNYSLTNVAPGSYTVRFNAANYNSATLPVTVSANQPQTLNAALTATNGGGSDTNGTINGTITDAVTGSPIAGASVMLNDGGTPRLTTTNAAGQYTFTGVYTGVAVTVQAQANDYQSNSATATLPQNGTATINLSLQPLPGTIQGTVTGSGNAPLAGVQVQLVDGNGNVIATATTDASGHYTFANVPPGSYTLRFTRDGYVSATETAIVPRNGTVTVNANLTPIAGSVSGIVRDTESGNPISGATVTLRAGATMRTATTNGAGQFVFANVDANVQTSITATHPDYFDGEPFTFTLTPQGSLSHDLELQPRPGSIGGRVSDGNGAALAGVMVRLLNTSGIEIASTTTDGSGMYQFSPVEPGQYTLGFTRDGYTGASATAAVVANHRTTVDQTLDAISEPPTPGATSVYGIVRDAISGAPVAGIQVTLTQGATVRSTTTDANGEYSFDDITAGVSSTLSATGGEYEPLTTAPFTPTDGTSERHDLSLQPKPGSLSGTVTDAADSRKLVGVTVELRNEDGDLLSTTTTDALGVYRFNSVPAGAYRLDFRASGYRNGVAVAAVLPNHAAIVDMALLADDGGDPTDPTDPSDPDAACGNTPPMLSVPPSLALNSNESVEFFVAASDADGVTLRAEGLPECSTFDPSTGLVRLSGSRDCWAETLEHVVIFEAVDGKGAITSAHVKISIAPVPAMRRRAVGGWSEPVAPIISRPAVPVVASLGDLLEIPIRAEAEMHGCDVAVDVTAPASAVFQSRRGVLAFAPRVSDMGKSEVVIVRATDCRGITASASFVLVTRGNAADARLAIPMRELEFGNMPVGSISKPVGLLLRNVGGAALRINSISSDNARFLVDGALGLPVIVPAGRELELNVRFLPDAEGPMTGTLTVNSSDLDEPEVSIAVSGTGVTMTADTDGSEEESPETGVVLLVPGPQLVEHEQWLMFAVQAMDTNGSAVTLTADALPQGATFENGLFAYRPDSICSTGSAFHTATFTATAADGTSATASVDIHVVADPDANVQRAPVISTPSRILLVAPGESMAVPVRAVSQSTNCAVTYTVFGSAAGTFDAASGIWTVTSNPADLGTVSTVKVQATDCKGSIATAAFEVGMTSDDVIAKRNGLHLPASLSIDDSARGSIITLPLVNDDDEATTITSIKMRDGRAVALGNALHLPFRLAPGQVLPLDLEILDDDVHSDELVVTTSDSDQPSITTTIDVQ